LKKLFENNQKLNLLYNNDVDKKKDNKELSPERPDSSDSSNSYTEIIWNRNAITSNVVKGN